MARNWKPAEAVKAIKSGDKESIRDIGGRFPLFAVTAAQLNEAGIVMIEAMPEYITVRKLETIMKGDAEETETEAEAEAEDVEEKPVKTAKPAKAAKAAKKVEVDEDEEEEDEKPTKSAKALFNECKKAGLDVEPKKDVAYYETALKNEAARKAKEAKAKAKKTDDDEDWDV